MKFNETIADKYGLRAAVILQFLYDKMIATPYMYCYKSVDPEDKCFGMLYYPIKGITENLSFIEVSKIENTLMKLCQMDVLLIQIKVKDMKDYEKCFYRIINRDVITLLSDNP
jgi:hypothetical protein